MKELKAGLGFLCLGIFLILTGCDESPAQIQNENDTSAQHPQEILRMPDGRTLNCIQIKNVDDQYHTHYIYYFDDSDINTISLNYHKTVSHGKTTSEVNQVVVIDGKQYKIEPFIEKGAIIPIPKTNNIAK